MIFYPNILKIFKRDQFDIFPPESSFQNLKL